MMVYWRSNPVSSLAGEITVPGDKSISHRSIMLGALAEGITRVSGFLEGEDCLATLRAFAQMGVPIEHKGAGEVIIHGQGLFGLQAPEKALDVGNSGTSMRLMSGVLAGQTFNSVLVGDASLMKRPMQRVATPLQQMGAEMTLSEAGTAPISITGQSKAGARLALKPIHYTLPVASAQLKSALLLAGLYADGITQIVECGASRDHSERMLRGFGVQVEQAGNTLSIQGGQTLRATSITVPGDVSSAAFFIVAALIAPKADILILQVGINPTRAAVIDILKAMGAKIELMNRREVGGEPVADIRVRASQLHGIDIPTHYVPIAIDEFPIIFVAASFAKGKTTAREIGELRVKESDRLAAMATGLAHLGVRCNSGEDWLEIEGGEYCQGGEVDSVGDHRIAMSFAVAAIRAKAEIVIADCANVATSFPTFRQLAQRVGMQVSAYEVD